MGQSLTQRFTNQYELSYSDAGTDSDNDLSVWRPRLRHGEFRVTYFAKGNCDNCDRDEPNQIRSTVVEEVRGSSEPALAPPAYFECAWHDGGSGGNRDGSFWKAIPRDGYVCLSDVAIHRSNRRLWIGKQMHPREIDSDFMCVHASLVAVTDLTNREWKDSGSGAKEQGAVWNIAGSTGMRVSNGHDNRPEHQQYRLKAFAGTLYADEKLVWEMRNPNCVDHEGSFDLTQGLTSTTGEEFTESREMAQEVAFEANIGFSKLTSMKLSAKMTQKWASSKKLSSSSTSTRVQKVNLKFKVAANAITQIWQLVGTDSPQDASIGSFLVNTEITQITYVPLAGGNGYCPWSE